MKILAHDRVTNIQYKDIDENLKNGLKSCDPLVWGVITSINNIYIKFYDILSTHRTNVGIIQFGNSFPSYITHKIVDSLKTRQRVSPVDFINANVGAPLSIACTTYKFQGPTLVLTMSPTSGRRIAEDLAQHWLFSKQASHILLVEALSHNTQQHTISSQLVSL